MLFYDYGDSEKFTAVSSASSKAQFAICVDVGIPPSLEMTDTANDIRSFSLSNFLSENKEKSL